MNNAAQDYQTLLTEVLQKQIIVLGPQITLTKARNVQGLSVSDDGHVNSISGDPKEVSIKLLEQFRELSPLLVKKTMKDLLSAIISSFPTSTPPPPPAVVETKHESQPGQVNPG
jgi:hypothetical protein